LPLEEERAESLARRFAAEQYEPALRRRKLACRKREEAQPELRIGIHQALELYAADAPKPRRGHALRSPVF
jgi:hypothetical protein